MSSFFVIENDLKINSNKHHSKLQLKETTNEKKKRTKNNILLYAKKKVAAKHISLLKTKKSKMSESEIEELKNQEIQYLKAEIEKWKDMYNNLHSQYNAGTQRLQNIIKRSEKKLTQNMINMEIMEVSIDEMKGVLLDFSELFNASLKSKQSHFSDDPF